VALIPLTPAGALPLRAVLGAGHEAVLATYAPVPRHRRDPLHRRDVPSPPAGLAGGDRGLCPRKGMRTAALLANTCFCALFG
jgi:hypothetical protein